MTMQNLVLIGLSPNRNQMFLQFCQRFKAHKLIFHIGIYHRPHFVRDSLHEDRNWCMEFSWVKVGVGGHQSQYLEIRFWLSAD